MLETGFSCGSGTNIDSGIRCDFDTTKDELLLTHGIQSAKAAGTTMAFAI